MDTEENKGVVRQYVDEVFNAGDFGVVEEIVDESTAYREAGRHIDGRDAFKRGLSAYLATFWTVRLTIDDLVPEAHRVAFRWTVCATHTGPLMGIAPDR
jgi:predicted ester cyclase